MKTIQVEGRNISYQITGRGPVLLFLHGFAESHLIWERQVHFFASTGFRVIVPDLPGFGASDVWPEITIPGFAQVVRQMLVHENIPHCAIFGHSMGGYIALSMAAQFPYLVSALGIIHSHPFADAEERKEARQKSVSFIREHGLPLYLKQLYPGFFPSDYTRKHPEIINILLEQSRGFSPDGVCAALMAMANREDASNVLRSFSGPVLFVLGEKDELVPTTPQMLLQTQMPARPTVCLLKDIGHMSLFEAPDQLHSMLDSFVRSLEVV